MNLKDKKGSISIFVLVMLLFMSAFLIILYANNVNKSKTIKEQFNIISQTYAYGGGDEGAYDKAYTDLRNKNKQTMTATSEGTEDTGTLELTKTFNENMSDYRIYGNSVQDTTNGDPSPTNPVEIQSVGDKTTNLFNPNTNLEKVGAYLGINTTGTDKNYTLCIKLKEGKTVPDGVYFGFVYYKEETSSASAVWLILSGKIVESRGDGASYAITTFNPISYYMTGICCYGATQEKWDSIMDAFDIFWVEGIYKYETIPMEQYGYKVPVQVTGKNLLNPNTVQDLNVYIRSDNGEEHIPSSTGGTWRVSDYIYVTENKTYHLNAINNNASIAGMAWYDTDKNYISGLNTTSINQNNGNITVPEKVKYLRISWRIDEGYNPNWENTLQLEEGTTETEYETYKMRTVNIYLDEPLRKVGDEADYIDFKTGQVVRKVDEYAFTGEESWVNRSSALNVTGKSRFSVENVLQQYPKGTFTKALSNMSNVTVIGGVSGNTDYGVQIYSLTHTIVYFTTEEMSVTDFKTWLKGKNAKIIYQLSAEDNSEKITLPQLKTLEDYTNIKVLTEVSPSKIEVEYQGYTLD